MRSSSAALPAACTVSRANPEHALSGWREMVRVGCTCVLCLATGVSSFRQEGIPPMMSSLDCNCRCARQVHYVVSER